MVNPLLLTRHPYPPTSVVLPFADESSVNRWVDQDYGGALQIVAVCRPSRGVFASDRVRTVHLSDANASLAFNVGARCSGGDLLVLPDPGLIPSRGFVDEVGVAWDSYDAQSCDVQVDGVPRHPMFDRCLVVKRWVHTRLRGFDEQFTAMCNQMFADYRRRMQTLSRRGMLKLGAFSVSIMSVGCDTAVYESMRMVQRDDVEANLEGSWGEADTAVVCR